MLITAKKSSPIIWRSVGHRGGLHWHQHLCRPRVSQEEDGRCPFGQKDPKEKKPEKGPGALILHRDSQLQAKRREKTGDTFFLFVNIFL